MKEVSPVPVILSRFSSVRPLPQHFGITSIIAGMREIVEEPSTSVVNDTVYVTVTKDLKESKLNLTWALHSYGGNKICILHAHVPATMIPLSKFSVYLCYIVLFCLIHIQGFTLVIFADFLVNA